MATFILLAAINYLMSYFQKLSAECVNAGYSGTLVPFKCDLSNEDEILSMFSAIKAQHQGVDVCINNAGLAHPEPLLSGKTSCWRNMTDVRFYLLVFTYLLHPPCGMSNASP